MKKSLPLDTDKILPLLLNLSIPSIIGSIITMLYNIVDRAFIGKALGPEALAGITFTMPISLFGISIGMLIGTGSGIITSITLGQKNKKKAEKILGNTYLLFIVGAIFYTIILQVFLPQALGLMGASGNSLKYAIDYSRIFIICLVFMTLSYGTNNIIRAQGESMFTMIIMGIGAITNIVLDALFIFVFNWGVQGAAIATLIANVFAAAANLYYFVYMSPVLKLKLKNLRLNMNLSLEILKQGLSPFIMQLSNTFMLSFIFYKLNVIGGTTLGPIYTAIYGIVDPLLSSMIMINIGISQGMQPIVGFNYGANKFKRAFVAFKWSIYLGLVITTISWILFQIYPQIFVKIFTNDPQILELGSHAIRVSTCLLFFLPIAVIAGVFFQAKGDAIKAIFFNVLRKVVFVLPTLLFLPSFIGVDGIWISRQLADAITSIIMIFYIYKEYKKIEKEG